MVIEQTFVLLKPDAVQRNLIGKIIARFEDSGLKIAGMKMVQPDADLAGKHYILDEEWAKKLYVRAKETYEKEGKKLNYKDHLEMGDAIRSRNMHFLQEGPVVAIIIEGPHAIELVRKMVGHTEPRQAVPGTIRGDFASVESYTLSDSKGRVIRNLIHASDTVENAKREIALWFNKDEVHDYKKDLDKHF
jgi:nucleoside-diphosphate kinase